MAVFNPKIDNFLLQAAGLGGLSAGAAPEDEEIVVNGIRPGNLTGNEAPLPTANIAVAPAASVPPQQPQITPYDHSGRFGVKGTLRDILGTLGDAFLVQSGNKAVYAPQRQAERLGDAQRGFADDPLAAIEALNASGFGPEAQELYKQHQADQFKKEAQAIDRDKLLLDTDKAAVTAETAKSLQQQRGLSVLRGMYSTVGDSASLAQANKVAAERLKRLGLEDLVDRLPKTPEEARLWQMDPARMMSLEDADANRAASLQRSREAQAAANARAAASQAAQDRRQQRAFDFKKANPTRGRGYQPSGPLPTPKGPAGSKGPTIRNF